ncbi:DUF2852 domain-containing protein [Enterovirga sp. CN4-39]|uniref:DUF2852 domain-containing protein n=1 Tax=Enterovirga sp. CN4-39 TaxID=3400910 RepID=UPI003C1262F9
MSCAKSSGWNAGEAAAQAPSRSCSSRRPLEIIGVVFLFLYFWPLAVTYLVWKFMGYPVPHELRRAVEENVLNPMRNMRWGAPTGFAGTGNLAFDEYRRSELERLERERRKLDDEAREFRDFVEELKRAKDREEFDAYMARRRNSGPTVA